MSKVREIPKNEECWVENCKDKINVWPYCDKHRKMQLKGYLLDLKPPGIKGFDNTPTKT